MSPPLSTNQGDTSAKLREWSSLIGIVTAIVGNVFISFALNIQRYAHIRLGREQEENNERLSSALTRGKHTDYGTQQSQIAEERAKINLQDPPEAGRPSEGSNGNGTKSNGVNSRPTSQHSHDSSSGAMEQSESEKPDYQQDRKSYLKSPYWWAGIILMICGEAGNFIAYGFAPASIVSPLGVVALVSNCLIAPLLLKERFRQRDFWGVAIAIAGAVTIVLSAKNSENRMGPDDVWAAITRWEFETYLGITAALMIILMWASGKYGEKTILIDLGLVGLFGGYTALSTKGVASLLSDTLWRALTFPITYLLVFILVLTALLQIRYVNRALQRFNSTQVIPVQFVLFTISVIVGSAILYRDFQSADAARFGKFFGGCALTFLGVYLITSARPHGAGDQGRVDLDGEENTIGMIDEERYQDEVDDNQEGDDQKRRNSSISFAQGDSPHRPGWRTPSHDNGIASPRTPPPLMSYSSTTSSKLSNTDSHLLENPWEPPQERPQPLQNTISSPLLPSEAQRSNPPSTPQTPPRGERRLSSRADRPSALSRKSMARLTPGPLMSPLSSSLAAVVADKRRGLHSPTPRARPGPGLGLRQSNSRRGVRSSTTTGGDGLTGSSPLKTTLSPQDSELEQRPPATGRSHSISATLGNLFRLKGERSRGKGVERNPDDTPS